MAIKGKEEDPENSDCPLCEKVASILEDHLCKEVAGGDPTKEAKCREIADKLRKIEITVEEFIEKMMELGIKKKELRKRLKEELENEKKGKAPKGKGHRRSV